MNSLQIAPIPGFKSPSVPTGSPAGEATHSPADPHANRGSSTAPDAPVVFNANGQTLSQQVAAARGQGAHPADDHSHKPDGDKDDAVTVTSKPSYALKIGYENGDHVVIDIVDPKLHRTV